jgi:formylglycine-generating enzyme required for sulfatase activity
LAALVRSKARRDTVLVAFAGHGIQSTVKGADGKDKEEAFFCPQDAQLNDPAGTMIALSGVYEELRLCGAGVKLLLVDACRDDPSAPRSASRGVDGDNAPRPPRGVAALFSCSAGQISHETSKFKHGVFFYYLLEGLRGAAKNNEEDKEVTWHSLSGYVQTKVSREVPKVIGGGARQAPNMIADLSGESPVLVRLSIPPIDSQRLSPKEITNSLGMRLVRIPAGKFMMGSPDSDSDASSGEMPQHEVEITKAFYLGVHTVTVGQFQDFVRDAGYQTEAEKDGKGGWGYNEQTRKFEGPKQQYTWKNTGWEQTTEHPVVNVSWNDAVAFCEWLSRKEGKQYRLPTEAEWEYSCRAGTITRYYSGNDVESVREVANIADASFKQKYSEVTWAVAWDDGFPFTAPIGRFKPNDFGLYDMHGNVLQWCADWYDEKYYRNGPAQDPQGPSAGSFRVFRGGSFSIRPVDCRAARRFKNVPAFRNCLLGFRVVLVR